MVEEWMDNAKDGTAEQTPPSAGRIKQSAVTIQGLQCMLEGTSTPNNAIFIFTSSVPLPNKFDHQSHSAESEWRGLLRRLPVQVQIPATSPQERREYCRHFLSGYLKKPWNPSCGEDYTQWEAFERAWSSLEIEVPLDMLAKYAQEKTHEAYIQGLMTSAQEDCRVPEGNRMRFLNSFFNPEDVRTRCGTSAS